MTTTKPNLPDDFQIQGTEDLEKLRPSPTNPRKHFPKDEIEGLAESFRQAGVLTPLLIRPVSNGKPATFTKGKWNHLDHFEVVDGERRYRAAKAAGLEQVPVIVRNLTDDQVRVIQLITFAQRADLKPSEEAAAYQALAAAGKTAEQIAAEVGKPLGFVRSLLRLGKLPTWAIQAVDNGTLPRATAELIARVPGEASRERAAACVLSNTMWPATVDAYRAHTNVRGDVLSYRDTRNLIQQSFTRELKSAPFDRKSLVLLPEAGSCEACPSRAGNDPEATAEGVRADTCMNPDCFRAKETAYRGVIADKAAEKNILPADLDVEGFEKPPRGWLNPEEAISGTDLSADFAGYQGESLAKKLGKDKLPQKYFAWGKSGKVVYLVKTSEARKALVEAKVLKKQEPRKKAEPVKEKTHTAKGPDQADIARRAMALAGKVLSEYGAEQCASLSDCDDAHEGGPICDVLEFIARFLIEDHCDYGAERLDAVAGAFGVESGPVKDGALAALAQWCTAEPEVKGTAAKLLGACLHMIAYPVLEEGRTHITTFAENLLGWAELDWDQLKQQAERELKTGVTAEQRLDAVEGRACRICKCTEADCSKCIARTGTPCSWSDAEKTLCSACLPILETDISILFIGMHAITDQGRTSKLDAAGIRTIGHVLAIGPTPKGMRMTDVQDLKAAAEAFVKRQLGETAADQPNTLEGELKRLLLGRNEWSMLIKNGATDDEVKHLVDKCFGLGGGRGGPNMVPISYNGGSNPKFYWNSISHHGKPTLTGKPLIDKVREVLGIPQKAKVPA